MVGYILKNSFAVLAKKPVLLWGISLMNMVITILVIITGFFVPIIFIPVILTLSAGMSALYLDGYNGKVISSKQLFRGFSRECFPHVTGGMCWYQLWSYIWGIVPFAGIVKMYSYRFTPYILLTRPEIDATDALKLSMMETKGYKLIMFLTDLLIFAAIVIASAVLGALSGIPYVGWLFGILSALFSLAVTLFLPLFYGIVGAAFYQETKSGTFTAASYKAVSYNAPASPAVKPKDDGPTPKAGDWYCRECGTLNAAGTFYCRSCGKKNGAEE